MPPFRYPWKPASTLALGGQGSASSYSAEVQKPIAAQQSCPFLTTLTKASWAEGMASGKAFMQISEIIGASTGRATVTRNHHTLNLLVL